MTEITDGDALGAVMSTAELEAKVAELQSLVTDIFAALDGDGIEYEYGTFGSGKPATIGGIASFTADWNSHEEPAWRGERWEDLTREQRFESAKFSAQHALIKELGDLRRRHDDSTN